MLVLTRKKNESIRIGDNIVVVVLDARDDMVKLGIEAPADMKILRSELYQAVQEENTRAARMDQALFDKLALVVEEMKEKGKGK